jgi:hypothetical protein
MNPAKDIGLPEALERAATALSEDGDAIRPANGDPFALLSALDAGAAKRVLEWLLVNEPIAGADLVEAWASAGSEATSTLLAVDIEGLPKVARKALRRVHHRLRSRGESVPEPDHGVVVRTLPKVEDELDVAVVSAIDPTGTRMVYLVEANPAGGARMYVITLDECRGVVEAEAFNAGRSKIRTFLRDALHRTEFPAVNAPPESVRALIQRIANYQPTDRPAPRAFAEWRSHVARPPEGTRTPGELVCDALGEELGSVDAARKRAIQMVRDQTIGPWPSDRATLQKLGEQLNEIGSGVVIVSGAARQEQVAAALQDAVAQIFEPGFGERTAERYEESAYVFWRRDQLEEARACLAAAAAFRGRGPELMEIGQAMLEVTLAPVLASIEQKSEGQDNPDESLLVRP